MKQSKLPALGDLITILPDITDNHAPSTHLYRFLYQIARCKVESLNPIDTRSNTIDLGSLGILNLPYVKMGAIDTFDSFGLDELIIYSFYQSNKMRYSNVADIGGNIGVHATLMARCGWHVETFEPDPLHISYLRKTISLNDVSKITITEGAVASRDGSAEFVRVLGNTTSSHLAGVKKNPYGPLIRFAVPIFDAKKIARKTDFMKIDAEGAEADILSSIDSKDWEHLDVIAEIGNPENGKKIFNHCQKIRVNIFAQKINWQKVTKPVGMPGSYKDGSVFLSKKSNMPWGTKNNSFDRQK